MTWNAIRWKVVCWAQKIVTFREEVKTINLENLEVVTNQTKHNFFNRTAQVMNKVMHERALLRKSFTAVQENSIWKLSTTFQAEEIMEIGTSKTLEQTT